MSLPRLRSVTARAVLAPLRRPAVAASGSIPTAPLVLVDLLTDDDVTGHAYLFTFTPAMLRATVDAVLMLGELAAGASIAPRSLVQRLRQRLTLHDTHGVVGQALAAIDIAAWDVHAQCARLPLAALLGSERRNLPAYNSCGLWIEAPAKLADEAEALLAEGGFRALKLRLGRARFADDLAAVRAVRGRLADDIDLMCDFNQALPAHEALARCRALDDEGLYWFEEPLRHDDYAGAARIAAAVRTPVQIGENLRGMAELEHALAAGAATFYMPDVQRIGGVGGWLDASARLASAGHAMSSHLFPEVSCHLLAASPTAHWLEYMDWADAILAEPLVIRDGLAEVPQRAGNGLAWNEDAVRRYACT